MNKSIVNNPSLKRSVSERCDYLYPNSRITYFYKEKSNALRILSSVSAFIKLFEALFWLSLLLEATNNEDDYSTPTLTVILAIAFVITIMTGLMSMFGPCFHGIIQFNVLIIITTFNMIWDIVVCSLCFVLDYYKHSVNKDNQTETAFNATIGLITAGAILVTTKKLLVQEIHHKHWNQKTLNYSNVRPLV